MDRELKQGTKANISGKVLEQVIIPMFNNFGYNVIQYNQVKKNPELEKEDKIVIFNIPFISIYNHKGKTEYLIINKDGVKTRVEAKNQQCAGSVDEKLSYLFINTIYSYPEENIILLIEGNGWKEGSKKWLENAVKEYNEHFDKYKLHLQALQPMFASNQPSIFKKKILVMNLSEFLAYFQKNFA